MPVWLSSATDLEKGINIVGHYRLIDNPPVLRLQQIITSSFNVAIVIFVFLEVPEAKYKAA